MKTKIAGATAFGGPLYNQPYDDGSPCIVCSYFVGVDLADGRQFTHPHAFAPTQREAAERMAERVNAAGEVDLSLWLEVEPYNLEDSLNDEAEREQYERHYGA